MSKMKIGIVGHGFVGKAVEFAFTSASNQFFLVDPYLGTTIDDLVKWDPNLVFICAPTPMRDDGYADCSIVEDAILKVWCHTKAGICLKSTVPPDVIERIVLSAPSEDHYHRFVYHPEFLRESSAFDDILNPHITVMGGSASAVDALLQVYHVFSRVTVMSNLHRCTVTEAAFIKYAINAYLATKVTFFNNLRDAIDDFGCNFNLVARAVGSDPRIGAGHTMVPGYDNKRGYGGACFPKDVSAMLRFTGDNMELLNHVQQINNKYRSEYDVGSREAAQNIKFGEGDIVALADQSTNEENE